jgi:hypothetical protein
MQTIAPLQAKGKPCYSFLTIASLHMKIWSIDEEAKQLAKRFHGINRAAFARDYEIAGGQSMIYQHITGRRPISPEAAQAYARGFGCKLEEISPRLAEEAKKAALSLGEVEVPHETSLTKEQKQMLMFMERLDKEARDILLNMGEILMKRPPTSQKEDPETYGDPDYYRSKFEETNQPEQARREKEQ